MAKRFRKIRTPKVTQPRDARELMNEYEGESDVDDMHLPSIPKISRMQAEQMLEAAFHAETEALPKTKTPVVAG